MDVTLNTEQWEILLSIIEHDKVDPITPKHDTHPDENTHRAAVIQEALELLLNYL